MTDPNHYLPDAEYDALRAGILELIDHTSHPDAEAKVDELLGMADIWPEMICPDRLDAQVKTEGDKQALRRFNSIMSENLKMRQKLARVRPSNR